MAPKMSWHLHGVYKRKEYAEEAVRALRKKYGRAKRTEKRGAHAVWWWGPSRA